MVTVLVCGGSGYLGQHLAAYLAANGHSVAYTFAKHKLPTGALGAGVLGVQVDMVTGEGLNAALTVCGQPLDVVVNTCAISQLPACERDYTAACAVNVPTKLLDALVSMRSSSGTAPLLVHISTDQVHDGTHPMCTEDTAAAPINEYGRSKLEAEAAVAAAWPTRHAILRSSLIYGPMPPASIGRQPFLQFVYARLRDGIPTAFFEDEVRCPVYVHDICRVVERLASKHAQTLPRTLYNMGGPQRLSRVDIAHAVAQHGGFSEASIVPVPSASVDRGYRSPLDISMDSTQLTKDLQLNLTPLEAALEQIWPASAPPHAHSSSG